MEVLLVRAVLATDRQTPVLGRRFPTGASIQHWVIRHQGVRRVRQVRVVLTLVRVPEVGEHFTTASRFTQLGAQRIGGFRRALHLVAERNSSGGRLRVLRIVGAEVRKERHRLLRLPSQFAFHTTVVHLRRIDGDETVGSRIDGRDDEVLVARVEVGQVQTQAVVEPGALQAHFDGRDRLGTEQHEVTRVRNTGIPATALETLGETGEHHGVVAQLIVHANLRVELRELRRHFRAIRYHLRGVPERQQWAFGARVGGRRIVRDSAGDGGRENDVLLHIDVLLLLRVTATCGKAKRIAGVPRGMREGRAALGIVVQVAHEVAGDDAAKQEQFITHERAVALVHVEHARQPVHRTGLATEGELLAPLVVGAGVRNGVSRTHLVGSVDEERLLQAAHAADRLELEAAEVDGGVDGRRTRLRFLHLTTQAAQHGEERARVVVQAVLANDFLTRVLQVFNGTRDIRGIVRRPAQLRAHAIRLRRPELVTRGAALLEPLLLVRMHCSELRGQGIRQRHVHAGGNHRPLVFALVGNIGVTREFLARLPRDELDGATGGVTAVQRALRTAQHFHALQVVQQHVVGDLAGNVYAIDVNTDGRVRRGDGFVLTDAAEEERGR